jgi:hypothetical protein
MKLLATGLASEARSQGWLSPLFVCVLAVAIYSINLDYIPVTDELYHLLGARGFLEYGEPRIAEGVYTRTTLFTAMIAALFDYLGESIAVVRLPSVITGGAMMACMFAWTRTVAGTGTAWVATLAFLFSPFAVEICRYGRFYALQGLLFWLGAMATYAATAERPSLRRGIPLALAAAVCFAGALYLQILTAIGLVGIALWLTVSVVVPWLRALTPKRRRLLLVVVAGAAPLLVLVGFSVFGAELWRRYRWTPAWGAADRNEFWYYHFWLVLYYPTLWSIFPLAALAALAHKPKAALFCLCIFIPALLITSFGGMKDLDYLYYAFPFLFVIWGISFTFVIKRLRNFFLDVAARGLGALGLAPKAPIVMTAIVCSIGFILLANSATIRPVAMLAGITVPPEVTPPDWAAAAEPLRPWLDRASVVLTTSDIETLYFLGRYDVLINKGRLSELAEKVEFERDPRTGRPVVSTPESVALIMDCFPDGLLVTSKPRWRVAHQLDDAVADYVTRRAVPIELPKGPQIMAFRWERPPAAVVPPACAALPSMQRSRGPGNTAANSDPWRRRA